MNATRGILAILLAFALVQPICAQGKRDSFNEGVVFAGGSLKPFEPGSVGGGYLGGWGQRQAISFGFSYNRLNDYAVGIGKTFQSFPGSPVSQSKEFDLSFGYQVNLIARSKKPKIAPYLTAGGGYLHSSFVTTVVNTVISFPLEPPPQPGTFSTRG